MRPLPPVKPVGQGGLNDKVIKLTATKNGGFERIILVNAAIVHDATFCASGIDRTLRLQITALLEEDGLVIVESGIFPRQSTGKIRMFGVYDHKNLPADAFWTWLQKERPEDYEKVQKMLNNNNNDNNYKLPEVKDDYQQLYIFNQDTQERLHKSFCECIR